MMHAKEMLKEKIQLFNYYFLSRGTLIFQKKKPTPILLRI